MSKKYGDKTMAAAHKRDKAMRDSFRDYDESQLEEMTKKSPWFNANLINDTEVNEILDEMIERSQGRAIDASSLFGRGGLTVADDSSDDGDDELDEIGRDSRAKRREVKMETGRFHVYPALDIPLLYTEFQLRLTDRKYLVSAVLHNIKPHSQDHRALCSWNKYKEVTSPFLAPINNRITSGCLALEAQAGGGGGEKTKKGGPQLSKTSLFQNSLAQSRYKRDHITTQEVVAHAESALDFMLERLVLYKELLFFLFEWVEPHDFAFVMCFETHFVETRLTNELAHTGVILYRKDLMEYKEPVVPGKKTNSNSASTELADEDDDEASPSYRRNDGGVQTPVCTKYISSADAERECYLVRRLKLALHKATVSYVGSGYVKRT